MTKKTLPDEELTLPALCQRAARRWPDRPVMVFDETGEVVSYADLDRRSDRLANVLLGLGVAPGDRVAVMLRNRAEYPITWFAAMKIGAAMVPINVRYQAADAGFLLSHSGASALVTSREFLPLVNAIGADRQALTSVCVVDASEHDDAAWSLSRLLAEAPDGAPGPGTKIHAEMTASIQYTSGTTGHPKGCMMTHRTWIGMGRVLAEDFPVLDGDDVLLIAQPFYYADLPWHLAGTIMAGAKLVALDGFHPSSVWQKIQQYRATFYYCLGVMPKLLMQIPVRVDEREHHLRLVTVSGLAPELRDAVAERFGVRWYDIYGMTEAGWISYERPGEQDDVGARACVGRAARGREIRIADPDGQRLPRGEEGEVLVRGAGLFDGYLHQPEATAAVFHEGWFRTGDTGWMDERGRLFFTGRLKDMIRRSDENISAVEVEDVIGAHPAVAYAACIPVPDPLRGEEVKAYVVRSDIGAQAHADGHAEDEDTLLKALAEHCAQRIAAFKVPRYWCFRNDLPRTPSEKIAKGELRAEVADLRSGAYDRVEGRWWRGLEES